MSWFPIAIALVLGLAFGSFLTVAIHRVPAGESLVRPRSRCPSCGTPLRNVDNIPVVSWVALRGRCHACHARISPDLPPHRARLRGPVRGGGARLRGPVAGDPAGSLLRAAGRDLGDRHPGLPRSRTSSSTRRSWSRRPSSSSADLAGGQLDALRGLLGFLAYGVGLLVVALIAPRGMGMGDVKLAGLIGLVLGSIGLGLVGVAAGAGILFGGVGAIVALRRRREPEDPRCRTGRSWRPGPCSPSSSGSRSPTRTSVCSAADAGPELAIDRRSRLAPEAAPTAIQARPALLPLWLV